MILICQGADVPGSTARIPRHRTIYRSCQLSLAWSEFGRQLTASELTGIALKQLRGIHAW